ncbi:hypothetical protein V2J09_011881 [Rumex salicifolius]
MAAAMATSSTVVGLGTSSLPSPSSRPSKTLTLSSGFLKPEVAQRNPLRQVCAASGGKFTW